MTFVVVLEDDPSRVAEMRRVLSDLLPLAEMLVFDNAPDAVAFLTIYLPQTVLISLDHDLGPLRFRDGEPFEPGDGRDVASFLLGRHPCCPAIVHSANYQMVMVMIEMLRESGWSATIVTPYSQLEHGWIEREWRAEVEWLVQNGRIQK
jgi:hypothetical protein